MTLNKVTTEILRKMGMNQTVQFDLPSADAINTGKSLAYRLQNSIDCKFQTSSDYENKQLLITKIPKQV